jgi:hypothetical protein
MTERYLDPRDAEYAATLPADERATVLETVTRFRQPDRLGVGDELPDLALLQLQDGTPVELRSLGTGRPLVLVFGSFT